MGHMPESLRLYVLCKYMKWAHLPVAGGLYDQHPKLLDEWMMIINIDSQMQNKEMKSAERKSKASSARR